MKDLSETDIKDLLQYKNMIVVGGVVIAALLFIYNSYRGYQTNFKKVEDRKKAFQQAEIDFKQWKETKKRYNQLKNDFFKGDPIVFKKYVEENAKNANIAVESLKTSRVKKDFYQEATIQLGLDSIYKDLVKFIDELEKKNINIKNMFLRKDRNKGLRADLNLKAVLIEK